MPDLSTRRLDQDVLAPDDDAEFELDEFSDLLAVDDLPLQEVAEQTTYGAVVLDDLIRRQLTLSVSVALVFLAMLFGLPVLNLLFPDFAALPILGLPFSWLLLAVAIYPLLWVLAYYYVGTARKIEDDFVDLIR